MNDEQLYTLILRDKAGQIVRVESGPMEHLASLTILMMKTEQWKDVETVECKEGAAQ